MSVGFVGTSDGWQQLKKYGRIANSYQRADDGNVALAGELAFTSACREAMLAIGFGQTESEAAAAATASLKAGFDKARKHYISNWQAWQNTLIPLDQPERNGVNTYRVSTAVLASHKAADCPGAIVASLTIPWGFSRAMTIWEAIIWSGRVTWSKRLGDSWQLAMPTKHSPYWIISDAFRSPPGAGHRTCGSMENHTGQVSRWMSVPSLFC